MALEIAICMVLTFQTAEGELSKLLERAMGEIIEQWPATNQGCFFYWMGLHTVTDINKYCTFKENIVKSISHQPTSLPQSEDWILKLLIAFINTFNNLNKKCIGV